jgi:hypothetical protein
VAGGSIKEEEEGDWTNMGRAMIVQRSLKTKGNKKNSR